MCLVSVGSDIMIKAMESFHDDFTSKTRQLDQPRVGLVD